MSLKQINIHKGNLFFTLHYSVKLLSKIDDIRYLIEKIEQSFDDESCEEFKPFEPKTDRARSNWLEFVGLDPEMWGFADDEYARYSSGRKSPVMALGACDE